MLLMLLMLHIYIVDHSGINLMLWLTIVISYSICKQNTSVDVSAFQTEAGP